MGKMTEDTFSVLFEYGKKVYSGELSPDAAAKKANESNPEVAVSSAKHYITWYSRMKSGEFLTWNTNAKLLIYYVKRIIQEDGTTAGKVAIESARKYAQNAGRDDLDGELSSIAKENGIDMDNNVKKAPEDNREDFQEWLKNHKDKDYRDHTIYVYVHALDMIETWLSVKLTKPVLSTNSLEEFQTVYDEIMSVSNFKELNKEHGHGEMSAALTMYQAYISDKSAAVEWWPSLDSYNPEIPKEMWLDLLQKLIGPEWGSVLAMFYTEPEGITCSSLGDRFSIQSSSISGRCTQLAKRVFKETNCKLANNGDKDQYWPILFQGRDADPVMTGTYVWRLRKELYDALTEFNILRFLPDIDGEKYMDEISIKEAISKIKSYIAARGFSYPDGLIENYYLSLKSKPFVILAGTSGTGKTRLVKLFAEAIGADYKLVSVRPDWSDGSDLFGHYDLNGKFIEGPVCEAFNAAIANPKKPVMLCLDEMNLARVEYYLSDFLSVIESREMLADGSIQTSSIAQYKDGIPSNLYIIGTVNMDETTFPFSKKVLDRANTIEFSYVDLIPDFDKNDTTVAPLLLSNAFLKAEYLVLSRDCVEQKESVQDICLELQRINEILLKANAHVGYRVRDEIVFYMLNNKSGENLISNTQALDNEIMQKILPRIQGSSVILEEMLIDLFKYCMGNLSGLDTESGNLGKQMISLAPSAKYPESAKKIGYMMTRYKEDGFTSYWL